MLTLNFRCVRHDKIAILYDVGSRVEDDGRRFGYLNSAAVDARIENLRPARNREICFIATADAWLRPFGERVISGWSICRWYWIDGRCPGHIAAGRAD